MFAGYKRYSLFSGSDEEKSFITLPEGFKALVAAQNRLGCLSLKFFSGLSNISGYSFPVEEVSSVLWLAKDKHSSLFALL